MPRFEPLEKRFWKHVDKNGANGCWNWTGSIRPDGRGSVGVPGRKTDKAHRVSWRLHFGEIPAGLHVCHTCDNPRCVNPEHLWLGTHQDNMADMKRKGRGNGPHLVGESHPMVKLTDEEVEQIRVAYANGEGSMQTIGAAYGVSKNHVWRIVHRLSRTEKAS